MDTDLFKEKIVVVTGGASGIGKALCEELASRGAVLTVADINKAALEDAVNELNDEGFKAEGAWLDVADHEAVAAMMEAVLAEHGRLDYIFNNAGIGVLGEAQDFSIEDWHRVIDVNLYGVVHGVMAAYPVMVRQGSGHIVNTSSLAGLFPCAGEISYTASKYGIVGLSHVLRAEGAKYGVKVSVVCPGIIDTPIYGSARVLGLSREKLMKAIPVKMPADKCARVILRGVEKNRAIIPVTALTRLAWVLQRLSPGLASIFNRGLIGAVRASRTD